MEDAFGKRETLTVTHNHPYLRAANDNGPGILNAVKLDPRWIKGKNTVIEAETIASINKSLVISLADRRDMMIQLGADRREEFKGGVRILAEQNERDSLAARAAAAFKNGAGVQ